MSSSPDPLSVYDENIDVVSPIKLRSQSPSPRKALRSTAANSHVQDFYITTPTKKTSTPVARSRSRDGDQLENPWRIKLTVEAQRANGELVEVSPIRLNERTTTTTIPLKGGDDDSPIPMRARRNTRTSLDNQGKRNGTPKPKGSGRRRTMHEDVEFSWAPTPPRNKLWQEDVPGGLEHTPLSGRQVVTSTPPRYTPERLISARPFTRPRSKSRSRRKEITPRRIRSTAVLDEGSSRIETPNTGGITDHSLGGVRLLDETIQLSSPIAGGPPTTDHSAIASSSLHSMERSTADLEEEEMWRSMIRKDSVSPVSNRQDIENHPSSVDPTEEHQDYDTILESEEFSMVSVESLQSAGSFSGLLSGHSQAGRMTPRSSRPSPQVVNTIDHAGNITPPSNDRSSSSVKDIPQQLVAKAADEQHTVAGGSDTPSYLFTASNPPQIRPAAILTKGLESPTMNRVVQAGAALQQISTPKQQQKEQAALGLASPFDEMTAKGSFQASHSALLSPLSTTDNIDANETHPRQPLPGFSAATRRELRAGLRLGEELAKKDQLKMQEASFLEIQHQSLLSLQDRSIVSDKSSRAVRKSVSQNDKVAAMKSMLPRPAIIPPVHKLPSPDRSDLDESENCDDTTAGLQSFEEPEPTYLTEHASSYVDHTMLARQAEWQREREAVSEQIRKANASQVIIINSDSESDDDDHFDTDESIATPPQIQHTPIQRAIKQEPVSSPPMVQLIQHDVVKPRRSKIPSPWREQEDALLSNAASMAESEPDLFWQPDQAQILAAKKRQQRQKEKRIDYTSSPLANFSDVGVGNTFDDHRTPAITHSFLIDPAVKNRPSSIAPSAASAPKPKHELVPLPIDPVIPQASGDGIQNNDQEITNAQLGRLLDSRLIDPEFKSSSRDSTPHIAEFPKDVDAYHSGHGSETSVYQSFEHDRSISTKDQAGSVNLPDLQRLSLVPDDSASMGQHTKPNVKRLPERKPAQQTESSTSSWFSAIAAPMASFFTSTETSVRHFRYPEATPSDVLASSVPEALPVYGKWTSAHTRALEPLVNASTFYSSHIFRANLESTSSHLLNKTITVPGEWARTFTSADCGVLDAFLIILRKRGIVPPTQQRRDTDLIGTHEIARQIIIQWVIMVMKGEVKASEWKGVKIGLRKDRARRWREEDTMWKHNRSLYFEEKRKEFERDGLPSWREKGLVGPFQLD